MISILIDVVYDMCIKATKENRESVCCLVKISQTFFPSYKEQIYFISSMVIISLNAMDTFDMENMIFT